MKNNIMLTEESIRKIRNSFDEAIAPQSVSWVFKEYGLKLNYDEVLTAIKILDCILENPDRYESIVGVFMVRNTPDPEDGNDDNPIEDDNDNEPIK